MVAQKEKDAHSEWYVALEKERDDLSHALSVFDNAQGEKEIDAAIFELNAARLRYDNLILGYRKFLQNGYA